MVMNNIAKYSLELNSKDDTYTRYRIAGLKMAYYKCNLSMKFLKNPLIPPK